MDIVRPHPPTPLLCRRLVNSDIIQSFLEPSSATADLQRSVCRQGRVCTQWLQCSAPGPDSLGTAPEPAEQMLKIICDMILKAYVDKTLIISAHNDPQVCKTVTQLYFFCG